MPDPDAAWNRAEPGPDGRWRQFTSSLPMRTALLAVAAVWVLGAVWSFQEQTDFATVKGFAFPHLLPLVIDGFAIAMAGVAWAASLDARPAVAARLATVVAVAASSASNGAWAFIRSNQDLVAVVLGVAVPIAANLAFEVLLAELRRQVQRRRGLPPPVAIPYPRLIRFALAPFRTFGEWRQMVLELTSMEHAVARPTPEVSSPPAAIRATETGLATQSTPARPTPARPRPAQATPARPRPAEARRNGSATAIAPAASTRLAEPAAPVHTRPPVARATEPTGEPSSTSGGAPAAPGAGDPANGATADSPNGGRRTVDQRVELLARHLAATEDAGEFTGEMVGPLLGIEVAPRTGRRLLGQARELVGRRAQEVGNDPELSVIGGR